MRTSLLLGSFALAALVLTASHADAQRRRRRPPPAAGPGTLVVQSPVADAEVLVDEESVGFTPLDPVELEPGSHTVRVRRPGYTEFDGVVVIQPGESQLVQVDMIALAMVLTVRSTPEEARVFVDGTFRGTTPIELELIEGEHSLRVAAPRHHAVVQQITARPGETDLVTVELEALPEELLTPPAPEWYEEPVTWIAVGGGAVAVAIAIVLVAVLTAPGSQLANHCGEGNELCAIVAQPMWTFDM